MKINGQDYQSIWHDPQTDHTHIIDQTRLPFEFSVVTLESLEDFCLAITDMQVRGAPLIGATAAFGLANAVKQQSSQEVLEKAAQTLIATRPTAVNLRWAIDRMLGALADIPDAALYQAALAEASRIAEEDITTNRNIGLHGLSAIEKIAANRAEQPINILTHCNAGALATVDWGTALSPIYHAHDKGLNIHVWVDETRPRNQGASITAWELGQHGIAHTIITDNAGGHLMQLGQVDLCIVGSDRTTANGEVCNKIGTYLKALAAKANDVPFYVALPSSTIDWQLDDGKDIPIEIRDSKEITHITGIDDSQRVTTVAITPPNSDALNHAFDVTPATLVTGLITEHGIFAANTDSLAQLKEKLQG